MSVPPLHFRDTFDSYISGEVIIHPSAVLAPGVILQAVPNSKIIIGPGVCIGMGSILQVHQGTLEVEAGASLGAGFLMVGEGKIGENACIGAATTVFNCSVEPGQVVAPGSILGDTSRRVVLTEDTEDLASVELKDQDSAASTVYPLNNGSKQSEDTSTDIVPQHLPALSIESTNHSSTHIYGQQNIQRLLLTLFPHRQSSTTDTSDKPIE